MKHQKICVLSLLLLFFSSIGLAGKQSLGVFLASESNPLDVEKALKKDKIFSQFDITVFAQYKDFELAVAKVPFDIAILPSIYFKTSKDKAYSPGLQFTRKGEMHFRYQVFSMDKDWDIKRLGEGSIGFVEEIDRQQAKVLVKDLLDGKEFKRIKPVPRSQDLYPMLALGNSNYIMISPWVWESVKRDLVAEPNKVVTTLEIPYPQLGYLTKKGELAKGLKDFLAIGKDALEALGFDGIKGLEGK